MPLPPKIANAPELQVGLDLFYVAFLDLNGSRQMGYGEGPIRWETIHFYCEANGIVGEQREDMFYHMTQMDSVYLDHKAAKAKQESEASNKRSTPKRGSR